MTKKIKHFGIRSSLVLHVVACSAGMFDPFFGKRTLGLSVCFLEGTILSQSLSPPSCISELLGGV